MYYEQTKYKDFEAVCMDKYGASEGKEVYDKAEAYMKQMLDEADYRNSDMIKWHMENNIFPVLAYYMALLDRGMAATQAYDNVLEQTQRYARIQKESNEKLGKMPGAFLLFRLAAKKVMAKNFPEEGWEKEWVTYNKSEIHFNLTRCVYHEVVSQYGHPELCTVFCKNDTTAFAGYMPKIRFERSGTIGEGKAMCDFHFIKNN